MKYFIIDESSLSRKSFTDFLEDLHANKCYYRVYRYSNFYRYFLNLVIALINNKDIVLIDADFTNQEIENLGFINEVDKVETIVDPILISDKSDLVEKIKNSQSKITLFTSGTTGLPKLVQHTISSLTRMVNQDEKYRNDVWGLAYNPSHMAGLQVILQATLNLNTIVYLFNKNSNEVAENIKKYGITNISATPTFYRLLLGLKERFDSIKRITLGGEKSEAKLYAELENAFPNAKINNIYASTELGSLFVSHGDVFSVPDSIHDKVRVTENELEIHPSLVTHLGITDWYKTGDLVEIVQQKPLLFRFKNRKTEMINVGGYKVNPHEIEGIVRSFDEIEDVRVYGRSNSVLGYVLCMEFTKKKGQIIDAKSIKNRLFEQLQDFKVPRIIKEVEVIEKTRTGKISRK